MPSAAAPQQHLARSQAAIPRRMPSLARVPADRDWAARSERRRLVVHAQQLPQTLAGVSLPAASLSQMRARHSPARGTVTPPT